MYEEKMNDVQDEEKDFILVTRKKIKRGENAKE
jgi:hypothetical protein